jgi:hypothetical protein
MSTYGTAVYNGTTYTLYGRPGSTVRDEINRLANGGEYPAYTSYLDEDGASVDWAAIDWHGTVHAATTAPTSGVYAAGTTGADGGTGVGATITAPANAALLVDGVTLTVGQQVLYWQNTDAKTNGLYTVTNAGSGSTKWVITRSTNANNGTKINQVSKGDYVRVDTGSTYGGKKFRITTGGTGQFKNIVIGTDNITFAEQTIPAIENGTGLVRALNYKMDPLRPPSEYKGHNAVANECAGILDPTKYLELVTALRLIPN